MNNFSDFFKNKEDKTDFYIALTVIGLFLGAGLFFSSNLFDNQSFISESSSNNDLNSEGLLIENPADQQLTSTLLSHPKQAEELDHWLEETPKMDSLIETNVLVMGDTTTGDTISIDSFLNEIDTTSQEITIDSTSEVLDSVVAREIEKEPSIDPTSTKEAANAKPVEVTKPVSKPKPTASKPSNNTSNYDCVIVVGAFSVGSTAEKLKNKLIQQGYPAYTFFRKGNRVVGIKQSCKNQATLQRTLKKIKVTYKEAWVLRK